jgi:hypothetical protein
VNGVARGRFVFPGVLASGGAGLANPIAVVHDAWESRPRSPVRIDCSRQRTSY